MSAWRGVALEYLPEMQDAINAAEDHNSLWREDTRQFVQWWGMGVMILLLIRASQIN